MHDIVTVEIPLEPRRKLLLGTTRHGAQPTAGKVTDLYKWLAPTRSRV